MYCPQCGAANDDNAGTCSSCGFDLSTYKERWKADGPPGATGAPAAGDAAQGAAGAAGAAAAAGAGFGSATGGPAQGGAAPSGGGYPYGAYQPYQGQQYQGQPYQGPYQGPPYQQVTGQGNYQGSPYASYGPRPYGQLPRIPSYLGWAIAVLILCFWPTGIVAVVYASQVDNKLIMGDIAGAMHSSSRAKLWSWISFGIAIAGIVLAIIGIIIAIAVAGTVHVQGVIS